MHAPLTRLCADTDPPPRVLVVAAHADDETVGMAARLHHLAASVTIAHVTDGAPRNGLDATAHGFATLADYAAARRREAVAAMSLAAVAPGQLRGLQCPDQGASFRLATLAQQVAALTAEVQPELIVTHPYEGGHPDHDATAFAVHMAARRSGPLAPPIVEMTSYHMGPSGIETGAFLPADEPVTTVQLSPADLNLKRRMIDCFASQRDTLRYFPITDVERFRPAPAYDFTRPPHAGKLFYEQFDWGVDGERFRSLARAATIELGMA